MRCFLIILAGVFSLVTLPGFAQEPGADPGGKKAPRVIRLIFDARSPPFACIDREGYAGFDIDLGEALGKELGAEVKWIDVPFDIRAYSNILDYLRSQGTTEFKIVEKGLIQEDYGIAVSNGAFDVLAALNAALQQLELDGKYDLIYEKWFSEKPIEKK